MSNHPEVPMSDDDGRQQLEDELKWREREDFHAWLDEREKEMVDNLEFNLKQMWKQFERDFKQVLEPKHNQENDMRIGEMKETKFIKKEDVGEGKLVTIAKLEQQNVALDDQPEDVKWIIHFQEFDKGMVLNWTNIQLTAKAVGSEDTDDWMGKKVVVYEDPNVSFGGKLVGGIRIRAVKKQTTAKPVDNGYLPPESENPADF